MKASATAPANIAFIKYWGKTDPETRVPRNDSVSMNLSAMQTVTTVGFDPGYSRDDIAFMNEDTVRPEELARIGNALDRIRRQAGSELYAKVRTRNVFPKATGIASSASGFASLAVAAFTALDVSLPETELSAFCRTLSGTAARSIPDGFVRWQKGNGPEDSFAFTIYPPEYWDIRDVVAVVSRSMKKVGSTAGHAIADSSPFYQARMAGMDAKTAAMVEAIGRKDLPTFGRLLEAEALNMHAVCLTSEPALLYWEPATVAVMKAVMAWRERKEIECYFTIDAGPSVHVLCPARDAERVSGKLRQIPGVIDAVVNMPARGAHPMDQHLF